MEGKRRDRILTPRIIRGLVPLLTGAVCALVAAWGLTYRPAPPRIPPDTPEAWRILLKSEVPEERLASALLLASVGDDEGTSVVLRAIPSFTRTEWITSIRFLRSSFCRKDRLRADLARAFLASLLTRRPDTSEPCTYVLDLIPPGKEIECRGELMRIVECTSHHKYSGFEYLRIGSLTVIVKALLQENDRNALARCEEVVRGMLTQDRISSRTEVCQSAAELLFSLHADASLDGYAAIARLYPTPLREKIRSVYLEALGRHGSFREVVDLWIEMRGEHGDATEIAGDGSIDERRRGQSLRRELAQVLGRWWPSIPGVQQMRLSPEERDRLFLLYAHYCESSVVPEDAPKKPNREVLLRLLEEPFGSVRRTARRLINAGDRDLRPILIDAALRTRDPERMNDILALLRDSLGGVPPEVAESARQLLDALPPEGKARWRDPFEGRWSRQAWKKRSAEGSPGRVRQSSWGVRLTPWTLRKSRTHKAQADMRTLSTGLEAYSVDNAFYPPDLWRLTTPLAYVASYPKDVCAPSGAYRYTPSWRLDRYILSSTGSDGRHDLSLMHFMLTNALREEPGRFWTFQGKGPTSYYLKWYPSGYRFLEKMEPGTDVVRLCS